MPQTLLDLVKDAQTKGATPEQIRESFSRNYGLDIRSVPPNTSMDLIRSRAKAAQFNADQAVKPAADLLKPLTAAKDEPPERVDLLGKPETLGEGAARTGKRLANWGGGVVTGLGALGAGAAAGVGEYADAVVPVVGKAFDVLNDPFGLGPRLKSKARTVAVDEAEAANKAVRQSRKDTGTGRTVLQDLGDLTAGVGHLVIGQGLNMEGPPNESPMDTAARREQQGEQLAAGAIGGTKDLIKGLADPWETNSLRTQSATTAATLLGVGKGLRTGTIAAGEAAAMRGGALGKAGATVASAARATDFPARALQGVGERVLKQLGAFPGAEEMTARLAEQVKTGAMTADEAAKLLEKHTPWQAVAVMHDLPPHLGAIAGHLADVGKGALYGAALGNDVIGAGAGALLGAAVPVASKILGRFAPDASARAHAAYQRQTNNPAAQSTPAATEVMRGIVEPPTRAHGEVRDLAAEAGGAYKRGDVSLVQPSANVSREELSSPKPPEINHVIEIDPHTGGLFRPAPEVNRRMALGEQAQGTSRWMTLARDAIKTIDELKSRPDTASPERAAAQAQFDRLRQAYNLAISHADDHPPATIRRVLGDLFPPMNEAFDRTKALNAEQALRDQIAAGGRDLQAFRGGNLPAPRDPMPASPAYGIEANALAQSEAEHLLGRREAEVGKAKGATFRAKGAQPFLDARARQTEREAQRAGNRTEPEYVPVAGEIDQTQGGNPTERELKRAEREYNDAAERVMSFWEKANAAKEKAADNRAAQKIPEVLQLQLDAARQRLIDLRKVGEGMAPPTTPRPTPRTNNWGAGLDEAAGMQHTTGTQLRLATTNSPVIEKAIDRAMETMNQSGPQIPRHWFARVFTDVLHDDGTSLLFSPRFRASLTNEILRQTGELSGKARTALVKALDDKFVAMNTDTFGPNPQALTIQFPDGVRRDVAEIIQDTVAKNPRIMKEIRADAMDRIGKQLAVQAEDTLLTSAIGEEQHRFVAPATDEAKSANPHNIKDIASYTANVVDRVSKGEVLPQMPVFDPIKMADMLEATARSGAVPRGASAADALKIAEQLRANYVPASPSVQTYLNHQRAMGLLPGNPGEVQFVEKGAGVTLDARIKMLQAAREISAVDKWLARSKLAMTAFRWKTQVNNIGSNLFHTFLQEGNAPMQIYGEAVAEALQLRNHLKTPGGPDAQMYQSLSRAGLGNLANLDAEVGALQAMSSPHGVVPAALHHIGQLARRGYNLGDMPFKIRRSAQAYRQAFEDLGVLGVGETARLRLPDNRGVDMRRVDGGWKVSGKTLLDGSDALSDLIGHSAVEQAQANYINPTHAPVWIQNLHANRLGTIAAPFMSWGWGAMDLPGKPGLLSRMLGYDGNVIVDTNSPKLLLRNAQRAMEIAVRRGVAQQAIKSQLDPNRDDAREALPYLYGDEGSVDIQRHPTDPFLVKAKDFSAMSPYSRSALVWRLGQAGIAYLFGLHNAPTAESLEGMAARDRKRVDIFTRLHANQTATAKDALDVALLSGNPLLDLSKDLNESASPKGHVDLGSTLARFTGSLIGGTPMDVLRIGIGLADPLSKASGRPFVWGGQTPGPVDAGTYAADLIFGMGYRDVQLVGDKGKAKLYLDKMHAALTEGLVRDHRDRLEKLGRMAATSSDAGVAAQMDKETEAYAKAQAFVETAYGARKAALITGAMKFMGPKATPEQRKAAQEQMEAPPPTAPAPAEDAGQNPSQPIP